MPRSLAEYQRKRDFSKTPEPKAPLSPAGRTVSSCRSTGRRDFITTSAWRWTASSSAGPSPRSNPEPRREATRRPRRGPPGQLLRLRGTIPKGEYGGGTVMIWDWGTFELEESTPAESLKRARSNFVSTAFRLGGRYALVRTRSEKDWLLIKKKDEAADPNSTSRNSPPP